MSIQVKFSTLVTKKREIPEMKEDNATVVPEIRPDLTVAPHILPLLIELFAGEKQQVFLQQEQLLTHLTTCHYCRTTAMVMLDVAHECDHRNNNAEEPIRGLLARFARISSTLDAHEYELLGAYAEAVVTKGKCKADLSFPDLAVHLRTCSDCCSMLEATVAFITDAEETD